MAFRVRNVAWFIVFGLMLGSSTAAAADWDRFPRLKPGQHVGIKKLYDGPRYYELRSCYRNFESEVGAEYYGAMVDVTAENGEASPIDGRTDPYAEALADAWVDDGRLDPDDHLLVVLGIANRSIGIHAGTRWTDLGFEGETIDQTLSVSEFDEHMQSDDYANAMCSILDAVDIRLTDLQRQMDRRVESLRQEILGLQDDIAELRETVDARFEEDHQFGESLRQPLIEAKAKTKRADSKVEEDSAAAVRLVDEARSNLEQTRRRLETYDSDLERLAEVESELEALETTIDNRPDAGWDGPQAALSTLAECEQMAAEFRRTHDGAVADVRACKATVEGRLDQADTRYFYLMTVLPVGGTLLLLALLAGLLVARLRRRRRTLGFLEPELETWDQQLDRSRRHLHRLRRDHPGYIGRCDQLWEGDSTQLDRAAADAVTRMCLLESRGTELLDSAQTQYRGAHRLQVGPLEEALTGLREPSITFHPGDRDPRRRFALPLCEHYRGEANLLLGNLEDAHREAHRHLASVDALLDELEERAERAGEASTAVAEAVADRRELDLPAGDLEEALQPALDAWQQARRLHHRDPRRAADLYDRAADRFEEVDETAREGNALIRQVEGPLEERGKNLRSTVRRGTSGRSRGQTAGFAPSTELESTARHAERIVELVDDGDLEEADALLQTLETRLDDLEEGLELRDRADDRIPERIEELAARRESLQDRIGDLRRTLGRLGPEDARGVFREESRQIGQLQSVLSRVSKRLKEARDYQDNDQPVAAADQLTTAGRALDRVEAFVSGFDQIEQRVPQARQEAESLAADCASYVDHISQQLDRPGVAPGLRELVDETVDAFRDLRDQMENTSINALRARDRLGPLRETLEFLYGELGTDIEAYDQADQWVASLRDDLASIDRSDGLSATTREFVGVVDELVGELEAAFDDELGGRELLERTRAVSRAVGRARMLSAGQLDPTVAAEHLRAEARARLETVDGHAYGFGERADCESGRAAFTSAGSAMESGDPDSSILSYESAIHAADTEDARAAAAAEAAYRRFRTETLSASDLDAPPSFSEIGRSPTWGSRGSSLGNISSSAALER